MTRQIEHSFLDKAKQNKNDEFYTQLDDIARELKYYVMHFRGKVVYCNCDDPMISNFYYYFASNFHKLGLRKLIASCYKRQDMNLFSDEIPEHGYYYIYNGGKEEKMIPDQDDVIYFKGNGDFRSVECTKLLEQSDIVVTNPPFSLFRNFIAHLETFNKKYLVIANINAITYKEIFRLIQAEHLWLGVHMGRGISGFIVPDHYPLYGTETRIDKDGNRIISPNNCLWLTNLDIEKRHEPLPLTKTYYGNENLYPKYDNFDGININRTKDIPADYYGYMGVPITFLHKFNPKQFKIVRFRKGNDDKDLRIKGKCPYFRILIRRRNSAIDSHN